ncbi:MAG: ribonuclease PH [Thermomicrobiales bacterium]
MTTSVPTLKRSGDRAADAIRTLEIIPGISPHAEGSALIKMGNTHVYCTASVDERVPRWMLNKGAGWVTAEYSMLPRATKERTTREATNGKQGGRTVEIQRLIGRSLRAACDLTLLGERQIVIDCDVIQADGGTRCASITGGYVALALALSQLQAQKKITKNPLKRQVAAISVGVIRGVPAVDLDYSEDSAADVDFNVVMTDAHAFVELQGTAEREPFTPAALEDILALAGSGLDELFGAQRVAIELGRSKR